MVDTDRDLLVGATSMGPVGGEVLGLLALAVHTKVLMAMLRTMIYAYPTFHKGIEDALTDLAIEDALTDPGIEDGLRGLT